MSDEAKEAWDSVSNSIKNAVTERLNSPFLGVFLFSWAVWNHRLIFVLFSGLDVKAKFTYIDNVMYSGFWQFVGLNFAGPLASTLVYIWFLPWPTEWVHRWNLSRQRRLKALVQRSLGVELLTSKEGRELRNRASEAERRSVSLEQSVASLDTQVIGWRAVVAAAENSADMQSAIRDFLVSQSFHVFSTGALTEAVAFLVFEPGRVTWHELYEGAFKGAESWSIAGRTVNLKDATGRSLAKFEFDPTLARFIGLDNAEALYFAPSEFSKKLRR